MKKKILWVDDDIDVALSSFIDELKDAGYQVLRSQNPDNAWQTLERNSISAIIMDVMLPTGKIINPIESQGGIYVGLRLLEKIRAEPKYANIPALIFTILDEDKEVTNWAKKNGIEVLLKLKIYPEDLLEAINRILEEDIDRPPLSLPSPSLTQRGEEGVNTVSLATAHRGRVTKDESKSTHVSSPLRGKE